MSKKNKILIICIVCALAVAIAVGTAVYFALRSDDGDTAKQARDNAVSAVENAFLSGINSEWNNSLTDEELVLLKDAGDYVVTAEWTKLVCRVLNDSSLQTVKIEKLSTTLLSDDGKELLSDFSNNAQLIIPMLKDVGFTSDDVASVIYDLLCALANDGYDALSNMLERLDRVRDLTISSTPDNFRVTLDNIDNNRVPAQLAKEAFSISEESKTQMLTAFSGAQNAMNELVSFAYNMSVNAITDEIYDKLFDGSGALGSISESELSTLVNALLFNVEELKEALTEEEVAKLNNALGVVIDNFDSDNITSVVYAQIVKYAKYTYMIIDVVPSLCDFVLASADTLSQADFITEFLEYTQVSEQLNAKTDSVNQAILFAKLMDGVLSNDDIDQAMLNALVDRISKQGEIEYQKAVPIFAVDLVFNLSSLLDSVQEEAKMTPVHDVLQEGDVETVVALVLLFNNGLNNFKEKYYQYQRGEASLSELQTAATFCSWEEFFEDGQSNTYNSRTQTKEWYDYYMTTGVNAVNKKVSECLPRIKEDLKAFVADYCNEESTMRIALKELAQTSLAMQDLSEEELSAITDTLKQSCIWGITVLLSM